MIILVRARQAGQNGVILKWFESMRCKNVARRNARIPASLKALRLVIPGQEL